MKHEGSCHCGKVKFTVDGDFTEAMECNCSICRRKGYLLAFVSGEALTVKSGADDLATYSFNKRKIRHRFCTTCGCAPFGDGENDDGSTVAAVNLRCVPDVDLAAITINKFDGASL